MSNHDCSSKVIKPRRALISVSDKTGAVDFARQLSNCGVEILSTGGTAKALSEAGIDVVQVSDYTGFPELMGGRVKTLHPKIHGGILAREDEDSQVMNEHGILPIDIVAVNLYPFESVSRENPDDEATVIENIDVGGPAMLRAAAKNYQRTCIVVDANDYPVITEEIHRYGGTTADTRRQMAFKAFSRTAQYDSAIAGFMKASKTDPQHFDSSSQSLTLSFVKHLDMRYGENPHQSAAFYINAQGSRGWLAESDMLQGKPLSFNNVADADAAYNCVLDFEHPTCVVIKHATPCGVASAQKILQAYQMAYRTDATSAFGGVIAINRPLDAKTASQIVENQFVEVILAPSVDASARDIIGAKQNIRLIVYRADADRDMQQTSPVITSSGGGILVQQSDRKLMHNEKTRVVTQRQPSRDEIDDLHFAWKVAKHVKSNAIVYVRNSATLGIGAGQMSRVDSARIAALKAKDAGLDIEGAVMASDAFFPFRDSIDIAAQNGIGAVVQPGGSMRDDDVVAAADEHGMAMMFTAMRHFRH